MCVCRARRRRLSGEGSEFTIIASAASEGPYDLPRGRQSPLENQIITAVSLSETQASLPF